jgi:hypothetical protein
MISIPNIAIGGVLSVTIFSTSSAHGKIATGVMAIVSTILSSLSKHIGAAEKSQIHCSVVKQYQTLIQELNIFLHSSVPDQDSQHKFVQYIKTELDKLYDMQPEPSMFAVMQFERSYKTKIEEALFSEFEEVVMRNASFVQKRVSHYRDTSLQKRASKKVEEV